MVTANMIREPHLAAADLDQARLWVRRLKCGLAVQQPIVGDELRAIKRHLASRTDGLPWLFLSEQIQPLTRRSVNYLIPSPRSGPGWGMSIPRCSGIPAASTTGRLGVEGAFGNCVP